MFISNAARMYASLRWLASEHALGRYQLLVVVLDPTYRMLARLEAERDRIHALSDHALILVLGRSWDEKSAFMPGRGAQDEHEIFGFHGTVPGGLETANFFAPTPRASPLEVLLGLLDLPLEALPGVFFRSSNEPPVWVSLPDEDALIELLEQASRAAAGPARRLPRIASILDMAGLAGTTFDAETVAAWRHVLTPEDDRSPLRPRGVAYGELGRVIGTWNLLAWEGGSQNLPHRRESLLHGLRPLLRDDFSRTLETAAHAECIGDWGSVVVNIARVIEGTVATSLFAFARRELGVRIPPFLDWWDPDVGAVPERGPRDFNAHSGFLVGTPTAKARIPWRPPTLWPGLTTLAQHEGLDVRRSAAVRALMDELATAAVQLRNPPAHGASVESHAAQVAWELLTIWYESGCAAALAALRAHVNAPNSSREPVERAMGAIEASGVDAASIHSVVIARLCIPVDELALVRARVEEVKEQLERMQRDGLHSSLLIDLKSSIRDLHGLCSYVDTSVPWPKEADHAIPVLASREDLSRRLTLVFDCDGGVDSTWVQAVVIEESPGLRNALDRLRVKMSLGETAPVGQRSYARLARDIEHVFRNASYRRTQAALSDDWLHDLARRVHNLAHNLSSHHIRYADVRDHAQEALRRFGGRE